MSRRWRSIWRGPADPNAGDGQQDRVTVAGTAGADAINVSQSGNAVVVHGLSAEVTIEHADAAGDVLAIAAGAGDDTIDASGLSAGKIGLQLLGGDGKDVLIGSAGDDLIAGGRGDDVALMGAGDDTFTWAPGEGSDTVEGQGGVDTLAFNGANVGETIDISANGGRVLFHRDVASITMDLNDVEHIDFAALGGADTVVVHDLSGTDVSQVNVDLAGTAGGADTPGRYRRDRTAPAATTSSRCRCGNGALVVDGLAEEVVIEHFDPTDIIRINGPGRRRRHRRLGAGGGRAAADARRR